MIQKHHMLVVVAAIAVLGGAACSGSEKSTSSTNSAATAAPAANTGQQQTPAPTLSAAQESGATAAAGAAMTKLNLNTATRDQFMAVPGVGDRMVREFLEYWPYKSVLQFRREIGKYVSKEQVAEYEKYVFVPVDPNAADAETLQQLPGLDSTIAAQLIAARPCGLGLLTPLLVRMAPGRRAILALRTTMVAVALASLLGVYEHFEGNLEFDRETHPNASQTSLMRAALTGGDPLLAPGALAVAAALALAATYGANATARRTDNAEVPAELVGARH